jgi:5-methylcytosine-specific restriction protein B
MVYNERFQLMSEAAAFDLQLMQKILPRLIGSNSSVKRTLIQLMLFATGQNKRVEDLMNDASELYLPWRKQDQPPAAIYPQSAQKLAYMLRRLEEDGFTSFWLS